MITPMFYRKTAIPNTGADGKTYNKCLALMGGVYETGCVGGIAAVCVYQ